MSVELIDEDVRYEREERKSICELLEKVQGDLKKLSNELQARVDNGDHVDVRSLQLALTQIEDNITNQTEVIVKLRHKRFRTLPIAAPRKETSAREAKFLATPYRSMSSPGQNVQLEYMSKLLSQPAHPATRRVLKDAFGIPFSLKDSLIKEKQQISRKLVLGTTAKQLTSLPLINKRNALLTPPPISSRDAQYGLLSLLERGLIPKAADIVLDPAPVQQRVAALHKFSKRDLKALPSDNYEGGGALVGVKLDLANYTKPVLPAIQPVIPNEQPKLLSVKTLHVPLLGQREEISGKEDVLFPDPSLTANQQFKISIRSGTVMDDYPGYNDFKAENEERWQAIQRILECVERLAQDYAISVVFVDTAKLIELAEDYELEPLPKYKDLLYCISNSREVQYFLYLPGRRYKGHEGIQAAAAKVQATYRMYREKCKYLRYRRMKWAAGIIAMGWTLYMRAMKVRRQLQRKREEHTVNYRRRLQEFNWSKFNQQKRVVIHLPSKGYLSYVRNTIPKYSLSQNYQIPRICDVSDPNVEVVYVCPVEIGDEVKEYYHQLLNTKEKGDNEDEDVWNRIHFIVPEHTRSFGGHNLCLSSLLKYSPVALKQIKNIIGSHPAVIIPHVPMSDDVEVADTLGIPLLGSQPNLIYLYSTFAGRQALFGHAQAPTPPFIKSIHSPEQLVEGLAWLVVNHLSIKRWLFKINYYTQGKGFAYCDITKHLNCYKWMIKERERYGEKWSKQWAQEQAKQRVLFELPRILAGNALPCNTDVFPSWSDYLKEFLSSGGSIEAHPPSDSITSLTADILLKPDNSYTLLSTWDHIHSLPFYIWGGSVPQCSVDHNELNTIIDKISNAALERGLIGHVSIDFVTFISPMDMSQVVWAIDIDFGPTDVVFMNNLISMISDVPLDWSTGVSDQQKHYAVVSTQLRHSNLSLVEYGVFFQMCKAHLIGYNNKTFTGTIFTLIESQQRNTLGMICLQHSLSKALSTASNALSTIHQEICTSQMQGISNFPNVSQVMSDIAKQLEINSSEDPTET